MVPMKLDIVYMDTISLVNFTAQVYEKCIVVPFIRDWRLKTCLAVKCILRGPGKKRNSKSSLFFFVLVERGVDRKDCVSFSFSWSYVFS